MKNTKVLSKLILCCLLCGYNGIGEATEINAGEVYTGSYIMNATAAGQEITAPIGTAVTITADQGTPGTTGYSVIGANNGGKINFAANTDVTIKNESFSINNIHTFKGGSTATFAGILTTSSTPAERWNVHIEYSTVANFLAGSTTTIETEGNNSYGLAIWNNGTVNLDGTMTTTTKNSGAYLINGTDITAGAGTSGVPRVDGSALVVGYYKGAKGTLNIKNSGATAGNLTVTANGDSVAAIVDNYGVINSEAGTSLSITSNHDGQTALFVRGSKVDTKGAVTIKTNNGNGNAIFMTHIKGNMTTNTIDILGSAGNDIQITGDIYNYSAYAGDHLNITMATDDSFLNGDNYLAGNGQETNLIFDAASKWDGDNTVTATNGVNTITLSGGIGNIWTGDNNVNSANATNTITLKGTDSLWKGNSTLNAGTNTINISNAAKMEGNITVNNGRNIVNIDDTGYLKGDTTLNGGTNDVTMTSGTIEGNILVHNNSTNTIKMSGNSFLTGTGGTDGTVTVDNAGATNTMTIADQAIVNNKLINSAGTMTGTFSDTSKLTSDNEISGGTTTLTFGDTSTWENGNNVSTGGTNSITFNGTTGNTWTGDNIVNGANANTTITLSGDGSEWVGNSTLNAGTNTINVSNTSKISGGTIKVTNGTNTLLVKDKAEVHNKLEDFGGIMIGTFNDEGKLLADNEAGDAKTTLTFNNQSQWTGNNEVNGKAADFTAKFNNEASWQGNNTVSYGTSNITLSDTSTWGTSVTPVTNKVTDDGKNTITLNGANGNTWYGDSTIDSQNATNTINLSGTGSKWVGSSTTDAGENTINVSSNSQMEGNSIINGGNNKINVADSGTITGDITINNGTNDIKMTGGSTITGSVIVYHSTNTITMSGNSLIKGSSASSLIGVDGADAKNILTTSGSATVDVMIANAAGTMIGTFLENSKLTQGTNISNGTTDLTFSDTSYWQGDNYITGGSNSIIFNGTSGNTWIGSNTVIETTVPINNTITLSGTGSHWDGNSSVTAGTNTIVLTNTSTWNGNSTVKAGTNNITLTGTAGNLWSGNSNVDGTDAINNVTLSGNGARWEGDNEVLAGKHIGSFSGETSWAGNSTINGANAVSENTFSDKASFNGDNTVEDGSSTLSFTNDASWNGDNTVNGGTHIGDFANDTAWGGNNITTGGTNTTTIKDASTWTGDNVFSGGTSKLTLDNDATWLGNNLATNIGTNEVVIKGSADWEGMSNDNATGTSSVSIEDSGIWFMHGNSVVNNLNVDGQGIVDMVSNLDGSPKLNNYENLIVNNLTGNGGTFIFDTDLGKAVLGSETTDSDKLVVNGTSTGTHYVQVSDASLYTGTEVTGDRKLLLITDLSQGNYEFVGKALNQGGLWQVNPPKFFQEGNKWYLGYLDKEPNPDTTVSILDRQSVYNQWTRINNDTLRKRLGDLRYNESDAGVWVRYYNGRLNGTGYEQSYNTMQIGIDKTKDNMTYGLAIDRQSSNRTYTHGTGEGTNINGSLYFTKYTDTGSYWDIIAKYGKIDSEYTTNGPFVDKADYTSRGYSLSSEYGKTNHYDKGYFVEPKIQLTYGYVTGANYLTDRKTNIKEDGIKSLMGRVGVVAGRKINKDSDYYLKLSYLREFFGKRSVFMTAANGEKMPYSENYSDAWFEIGIGGNVKIAPKTNIYGDLERSFGADIEKKWQVNAGVRWEF